MNNPTIQFAINEGWISFEKQKPKVERPDNWFSLSTAERNNISQKIWRQNNLELARKRTREIMRRKRIETAL